MTSTLDPFPLCGADDPAGVLAYARDQKRAEDDAARQVLQAAARWAAMHSVEALVGPVDGWHESCLPLGGQGCPEVAEFAVVEFAAAMGRSTESGRRYLSHAVEGCYRLPRCWARVEAGELAAWRLALIADRTLCLRPEAAAFVDAKVAAFAHTIGPAQLGRLVEEAQARFDPAQTDAERQAAAEARRFDIALADAGVSGTVRIDAEVDLADALDLEAAIAADAHHQLALGSTDSLNVRRALAAGNLARTQQTLDLADPPTVPHRPRTRQVVLHVHLEQAAVLGAGGLARLQEVAGPVTAAQVREWCAHPDAQITVQPVLDLADHIHVGSYQASARLRLQTQLRDHTCAFPFCARPAEHCDCDHRVPHADDGPTCSCNLAPACRRHHRAKTTGGWTYLTVEPGTYLWRSPHGYQFLRDHTGTLDVTPDPERLRLAHQFRTHFGEP